MLFLSTFVSLTHLPTLHPPRHIFLSSFTQLSEATSISKAENLPCLVLTPIWYLYCAPTQRVYPVHPTTPAIHTWKYSFKIYILIGEELHCNPASRLVLYIPEVFMEFKTIEKMCLRLGSTSGTCTVLFVQFSPVLIFSILLTRTLSHTLFLSVMLAAGSAVIGVLPWRSTLLQALMGHRYYRMCFRG